MSKSSSVKHARTLGQEKHESIPGQAKLFSYSKGVKEKRAELERMSKHLKKRFCGIDKVISEITRLMEPWRVMSDGQIRPIIINLWGMTGTGKTSLVREIASFLGMPIIQVDLGEYTDRKNFGSDFYHKYGEFSGKECIILLDEIQNPRTTTPMGDEIDREGLRALWSLLSDGKIIPDERISKSYYEGRLFDAIDAYKRHDGVNPNADKKKAPPPIKITLSDGRIIDAGKLAELLQKSDDEEEKSIFEDAVLDDDDDDDDGDLADGDDDDDRSETNPPWYLSSWLIDSILELCNKPVTRLQVQEMLRENWLETAMMLFEMLNQLDVQPVLDYTKTIIFLTGNIDEVYTAAHNNNPDLTPDQLHEWSKKITVPDVKQALLRRFRPEQVARFGNNHILYPAFDTKTFQKIIKLDLDRIAKFIRDKYDVVLNYDPSVPDLIYREGVFPTQGARPVLTTVASLVESSIPECLSSLVVKYDEGLPAPVPIKVTMDPKKETISFFEDGGDLLKETPIPLSIDILRRPMYDNEHVNIAFHEAGHAVCYMMTMGKIPLKVCAFSPNTDSMGYMERGAGKGHELENKRSMLDSICVMLGGWAAEKHLFQEDPDLRSGGCGGDVSRATQTAIAMHQILGLIDGPLRLIRPAEEEDSGLTATQADEDTIRKLIDEQKERALKIVAENEDLLLDVARNLLVVPHLGTKELKAILKNNDATLPSVVNQTSIFERKMAEKGMTWGDTLVDENRKRRMKDG
jgi:cell division protease FtsH